MTLTSTGNADASSATRVARMARRLEADLESLATSASEAILAEIPAYGTTGPEAAADVRRHVLAHYRTYAQAFASGTPVTEDDLDFVHEHALRRVGEVTVGDIVRAFMIGQRMLWQSVRDLPGQSSAARIAAADALVQYFEVATARAAQLFLEYASLHAAADERSRRDVVGDLLAGRPLEAGRLRRTAEAHGLGEDGPIVVLSAVASEAAGQLALRAMCQALSDAAERRVPPLQVVRHDEIVVIANVDGLRGALRPRLEKACRALASRGNPVVVGVSTVVDTLSSLPAAYDEARLARDRAEDGLLVLADLGAFEYLTLRSDATGRRLVDGRLRSFIEDDLAAGGELVRTLQSYVGCDLNVRRTADQLHVHVNTAHYRLQRVQERTGLDLRRVADLLELVTAIRLCAPAGP